MKDNIILIGMPGSGKSTVGVLLAKVLGYQFVDTDLIISEQQQATLQEIIDTRGLEAFLDCEEQAGLSVNVRHTVIATGGSMVLSQKAMARMKENGTTVYLDVALPALAARLRNIRTRGVAARPGQTLEDIYRERLSYYERYADLRVSVPPHAHLEDVVEETIKKLNRCPNGK